MRTYGRVTDEYGNKKWVEVDTDANGFNDAVYVTTLAQVLKLNLGESPFYGDYGIPEHQTIMTQVQPDYYVAYTQQRFAQYFAALVIAKMSDFPPTYRINVTTKQGAKINATVISTNAKPQIPI